MVNCEVLIVVDRSKGVVLFFIRTNTAKEVLIVVAAEVKVLLRPYYRFQINCTFFPKSEIFYMPDVNTLCSCKKSLRRFA